VLSSVSPSTYQYFARDIGARNASSLVVKTTPPKTSTHSIPAISAANHAAPTVRYAKESHPPPRAHHFGQHSGEGLHGWVPGYKDEMDVQAPRHYMHPLVFRPRVYRALSAFGGNIPSPPLEHYRHQDKIPSETSPPFGYREYMRPGFRTIAPWATDVHPGQY
jgi:hypothetical protein